MMLKSKKGVFWNQLLSITVILLVLSLIVWILYTRVSPSAANILTTCTGGVWSTNNCNTSVSSESFVIRPKKIKGELHHCCIPNPGLDKQFNRVYAKEIAERDAPEESTSSKTKTGSIVFELDGTNVALYKSTKYTKEMQPERSFLSGDNHTFRVTQNIKGKHSIEKCTMTIRPVKVTDGVAHQDSAAVRNSAYEIEVFKKKCGKTIAAINKTLSTLKETTKFNNPGFYKWDFTYWYKDSKNQKGDGSVTTYIEAKNGSSYVGETPTFSHYETMEVRNNEKTCKIFVGVEEKSGDKQTERLPKTSNYTVSGSNEKTISGLPKTIVLNSSEKVNFTFEEEGVEKLPFNLRKSSNECTKITVNTLSNYKAIYQKCPDKYTCSTLSRLFCEHPQKRGSSGNYPSQCYTNLENCYWDYKFLGGSCENCDSKTINNCKDYETSGTCESNQCQENIGGAKKCYWETKSFAKGSCKSCDIGTSCTQYAKKSTCENDPCGPKSSKGRCKWNSGKCSAVS